MERRPEFIIVAGPNGAGKSKLGPFYTPVKAFDGDKLAMDLRREHPDWPDRWVSGTVASTLEKQVNEAISQHSSFAFETNFSNDMPQNLLDRFLSEGYKPELYYFGLLNEEECVDRVIQRSKAGGHDVADEVIRYNFSEGLKRIREALDKFENITFVDSNTEYGRIVANYIKGNGTKVIADNPPVWFTQQLADLFMKL